MTDHITKIREALEAASDGTYLLPGCDVKMFRSLLAALDEAGRWKELVWALARELNCLPSTYSDANGHVLKAAIALNQKLEEANAARLRAQEENAVLKERLASQRVKLTRELREQGWVPHALPHRPGCQALGGYGNGIGPCDCGAAIASQEGGRDA